MPADRSAPRAWSIRARLLLLVFALWLPAAAGIGLLAHTTYLREEQAARARIEELGSHLNQAVERELDKCAMLARILAASLWLREGNIERFHAAARLATAATPYWAVLVDREHQWANTLLEQPRRLPRASGAPLVTEGVRVVFTARGPLLQRPAIGVFAPEAGAQPPRYNVGVALQPDVVQALVDQQAWPERLLASIVDGEQRIVARSRDPQRWLACRPPARSASAWPRAKAGWPRP